MSTWTDRNQLFLALPTDQFLTILAYGEAGNQGAEGMMAVLNTVRNRTLEKSFYDTEIYSLTNDAYKAVGLKKWQFSMFNLDDPVRMTAEKIANNFQSYLSNSAIQQAYELSQMAIDGTLEDNTNGAQFYYNPAGVVQEPQWASVIPFLGQIGDHLFFGSGISAAVSSAVSSVVSTAQETISSVEETVSSVTESIGETVTEVESTIEEQASVAIGVMKEHPNVTILVLAGLGIGLYLELRKRKK